ncbi:serine protease [Schumannella sp. 10F1B-5-1]|uniref:trypsin-like serine peptidase n=1 Tax=Schumannella sp. 10F1B-5-1 TaxID=2590780 RepID=UPI001131D503|nr:hypothetical protein [Schumannella sp. 10F1B-5-1]TPW70151.1 hypothetical protein FJ658_14090 [Schumannella sp. 10F1B-5-1]
MTTTKFRIGASTAALLLGGAAIAAMGAASAQAAPAGPKATDVSAQVAHYAVPSTKAASTAAYWTADRMLSATPIEETLSSSGRTASTAAPAKGTATTYAGQAAVVPMAASESPVSHIGKVFFTLGGSDYVCSGNSISSSNGSVVATAGHCVNEGPGSFATNWTFVPAYENGSAPYGQWTATDLYAPTQWTSGGDITYDTGFAVVSGSGTLADEVGSSSVAFNQARGEGYSAYGYPAASPFNGETLKSCTDSSSVDDPYGQSDSQGIDCDMTGGSSGGPWFLGTGSGGTQNSVNSFGYDNVADTMFGPYWGSVIQGAYEAASNA